MQSQTHSYGMKTRNFISMWQENGYKVFQVIAENVNNTENVHGWKPRSKTNAKIRGEVMITKKHCRFRGYGDFSSHGKLP